MNKLSIIITTTAMLALMAITLTGCTKENINNENTKNTETVNKLRISEVTHSIFYAPQYIAMEKGFFEEEGIEIELINGGGADKVMAAVLSNQVEIGFAGPEAAIYVHKENREDYAKIFAQVTKKDGSFIVGREKLDFDFKDLKDKTIIGGRKGGVPYMTLCHIIKENGLIPNEDVILDDSVQFSLMVSAFAGGKGDFVTAFEPTASMIEMSGKGYILKSVGEESGEIPYTAYFAKKSFLENNSDLILRFTRAIAKAQKWTNEHSASEIADVIFPHFEGTDRDLLINSLENYKKIDAWNTLLLMTTKCGY